MWPRLERRRRIIASEVILFLIVTHTSHIHVGVRSTFGERRLPDTAADRDGDDFSLIVACKPYHRLLLRTAINYAAADIAIFAFTLYYY